MALIRNVRVNLSAVERRVAQLPGRRTVKRDFQVAWLLKGLRCLDLTTLSGDDTPNRVRRLCAKAKRPVRLDILERLGVSDMPWSVAAVCVYSRFVPLAVEELAGSGISVASVATGFPAGLIPHDLKLREIDAAVSYGASEIDVVITREHVLAGDWLELYREVREFKEACQGAQMKVILATGDLKTLRSIARAATVCLAAGADFIKTSTGKEIENATLPVALVILRAIRDHQHRTGRMVGYKPAGGMSTTRQMLLQQFLVNEELGSRWLEPDLFRVGASSLIADINRQLEHQATGRYSAFHRHAVA
ncbi:deoxyribose-phosphate aldolase [Parasphingorhabdus sp.]|uniref:deoxyribose-phosphate aldolase n=1 Tax=Parasphingorhabdus sp. TaxID=2709688 RepID=UPI0032EC4911